MLKVKELKSKNCSLIVNWSNSIFINSTNTNLVCACHSLRCWGHTVNNLDVAPVFVELTGTLCEIPVHWSIEYDRFNSKTRAALTFAAAKGAVPWRFLSFGPREHSGLKASPRLSEPARPTWSRCWCLCLSLASAPCDRSLDFFFMVSCGTLFQVLYLLLTPSLSSYFLEFRMPRSSDGPAHHSEADMGHPMNGPP